MSNAPSQVKPSGRKISEAKSNKNNELHCLITGFDAFADDSFNTSQLIVESLPKTLRLPGKSPQINLEGLVLPTCGEAAWELLKRRLEKLPRNARLMLIITGLAGFRPNIAVERFALNIRDYRIKDNLGHMIRDQLIDPKGPAALRTEINVEQAVKQLQRKGLPAEVSNYCGTFVCNEIYYQALRFQSKEQFPAALLFVHLPLPRQYGKCLRKLGDGRAQTRSSGAANQLLAIQEAVLEIGRFLFKQTISQK